MVTMETRTIHGITILPAVNGVVLSAGGVLVVVPGATADEARITEAALSLSLVVSRIGADGALPMCDVVLSGKPANRVLAVKAVRDVTGLTLSESNRIIARLEEGPSVMISFLSYHNATVAMDAFLSRCPEIAAAVRPNSLPTHAVCPACGTKAPFSEPQCRECGTAWHGNQAAS